MSVNRFSGALPFAVALVVIAVIWMLPYLIQEPELGFHFVSTGSSLLVMGGFILTFHGWLQPEEGDGSFRVTLAGAFLYATVGYACLAALAVLPEHVHGFDGLASSFAGWLLTVLAWPFVLTWMTACGLGYVPCPS